MPKKDFDEHFENPREEWTKRKHDILARYVVPGAAKIKTRADPSRVVLVDGYAGANEFAGLSLGSTAIMVSAARKVISSGAKAIVYAFEPDEGRFNKLVKNLTDPIKEGVLIARNERHGTGIRRVLLEVKGWPMIAFLDPRAPSEMSLEDDVGPYCGRQLTDVLGTFHGNNACRDAARHVKDPDAQSRVHPEVYLGASWDQATSADLAHHVFLRALRGCKKFVATYRIRKQFIRREAYAFFGLSDSHHGMQLLSDAIARDYGALCEFDASRVGKSLFADEEAEQAFNELVETVRPIVMKEYATGAKLAVAVMKTAKAAAVFGKFTDPDYTRAAQRVKKEIERG